MEREYVEFHLQKHKNSAAYLHEVVGMSFPILFFVIIVVFLAVRHRRRDLLRAFCIKVELVTHPFEVGAARSLLPSETKQKNIPTENFKSLR